MTPPLLSLSGISKRFTRPVSMAGKIANLLGANQREEVVKALDDINLTVNEGEILGLVGESGCGKSTLGRVIAGIYPASAGTIRYREHDIDRLAGAARREVDLGIQMVFQDPMASLNPRMRVVDIVGEAPVVHGLVSAKDMDAYVCALLARVGIDPQSRQRFPHQFSGGQRARIGIARALAVKPKVLICDESTAALDVSIQAQILNLFMDLRHEFNLTYLFISHDLGVVSHISDRVAVMYLGRIVELADTETLFRDPQHPYSQALLAHAPRLDTRRTAYAPLKGELPSPINPPPGCPFHPRCPKAVDVCRTQRPPLAGIDGQHLVACHLAMGSNIA